MRYLLSDKQVNEIAARQQYLYDIFGLYFIEKNSVDGFVSLEPMASGTPPLLFITGHANQVKHYLVKHNKDLTESTIIITSCFPESFFSLRKKGRTIYFSKTCGNYTFLRAGKRYGFDFDISDSELYLYNSKETDFLKKVQDSYILL